MTFRNLAPLLALGILAAPAAADPLPERSERVVDYRIQVRLDPETKELTGSERLTWRNPSEDEVPDLWFHLYLNAFRSSESTFWKESGGQLRGDRVEKDPWGWTDVTALRLADGTDLLPNLTFERPDDGNEADLTVARVVLPEPVGPGGEVELEIEFRAKLPQVYARTGYADDFFMVGQWFPKLGVYEPAGTRGRESGGWNCHQFHAHSEFYADYGSYEVEITLPSRFVVGATGRRTGELDNGDGTTTYVYRQDDVHDFAWTADPDYVLVESLFDADAEVTAEELAATAELLGRTPEELRLSDVEIRLLIQPEHRAQADRYIHSAKVALEGFGLAYGRYPYATLTIVDPPANGPGAGGMEYPTLITGFSTIATGYWPLSRVRLVEEVTVHEFGHQYWYGLVGSNEFEESWLDEGVNSYSTAIFMDRAYGPDSVIDLPGIQASAFEVEALGNSPRRRYDAIRTPAWGFSTSGAYGFYSYAKPALVLRTLENVLGERTMARVMRTYAERWRFRHPSSDDFYAVAEEISGRELDDFFGQLVEGTGVFDPAVTQVEAKRARQPRGRLSAEDPPVVVDDEQAREAEEAAEEAGERGWDYRIELRQQGEVRLPVEVELRFEGVEPERRAWDGSRLWERWEGTRPEKLLEVVVDPDEVYLVDAGRLNNARRTEESSKVGLLAGSRLLFLVQQLISGLGL
ncbi:MAG TPA: M1 family metallopeptidase [Thermoanaerobaculia bacterium]|nr:M1 family metallopeptidase [Thermoanaerobaculia bacterium]